MATEQSETSARSVQAEESKTLQIGPELDLGGRLIVGGPDTMGYETIAGAWDDAEDGDVIYVHGTYDAQAAGEPFPITLDYSEKQVMLTGGHPSGSIIDASHVPNTNVVEVIGRGQADYRNRPLVQHLKIVGGNVGMRIRGAPYSTYKDLVFWKTNSHGVLVDEYVDDGTLRGTFGVNFRNCTAWSCRGAGFKLHTDAHPHSTTFYGCSALFNGLYGPQTGEPGVKLRGYSSRWMNGTVQNNGGFGIDARNGSSQIVYGVYFEGNGMVQDYPHDIFVDEDATGLRVDSCSFQGGIFRDAPNGRSREYRGIAVAGTRGVEIQNCIYRKFTDAFLHLRDTEDADVAIASHTAMDDTTFQNSWDNTRLRSNGLVLPADLREIQGRYTGDRGVHDGSGQSPWGFALWDGDVWISVMNGKKLQ